ncbi:MAG: DUF2058 family protein [Myxococcota bacterium]|nr:DUF2058 family protein [Myxococcota bacterium]
MHNLREKLLSAGLVTEAQTTQIENLEKKKVQNGQKARRSKTSSRGASAGQSHASDPKLAPALKAIEEHRIRGDIRGTEEFHFEDRSRKVRRMYLTKEIAHGLRSGRIAIVESGDPHRHVIVGKAAIQKIFGVDREMVRYFNQDGIAS